MFNRYSNGYVKTSDIPTVLRCIVEYKYIKNYQKTGDLITLPYTTTNYVDQDKASRHINVNPYHVFAFIGNVKLTPENRYME